MKKVNKITIIAIVMMICSVLIMITSLSITLAKYSTSTANVSSNTGTVAKWGLDISYTSDTTNTYKVTEGDKTFTLATSNKSGSTDGDKILLPGTSGKLCEFRIKGQPETAFRVDFNSCSFSLGNGYTRESKLICREDGIAVEYFPIIIKISAKDNLTNVTTNLGEFKYYNDTAELCNDINTTLNDNFDSTHNALDKIDKSYIVEWEWLYTPNNEYQTNFLDTEICAAMGENVNSELFDITLDMNVTVSQTN